MALAWSSWVWLTLALRALIRIAGDTTTSSWSTSQVNSEPTVARLRL